MGLIPETFRHQSGVIRSNHPHSSFSAWGKHAQTITEEHSLDFGLGDASPLGRLYDLDAWILLLGVKHENNTSLHLAEYRADFPGKKEDKQAAPLLITGARRWVEFLDYDEHSEEFNKIGKAYRKSRGLEYRGKIGMAKSILIPQRGLVDFAVTWMEQNWDFLNGESSSEGGA